jgi:hypothetical protein
VGSGSFAAAVSPREARPRGNRPSSSIRCKDGGEDVSEDNPKPWRNNPKEDESGKAPACSATGLHGIPWEQERPEEIAQKSPVLHKGESIEAGIGLKPKGGREQGNEPNKHPRPGIGYGANETVDKAHDAGKDRCHT